MLPWISWVCVIRHEGMLFVAADVEVGLKDFEIGLEGDP